MTTWIIYCATNTTNGKKYIGQTKNFERRRVEHIANSKSTDRKRLFIFSKAIAKYGPNNFEWNILEECSSVEQADEREIFYISSFKTLQPNGYNLIPGGNNSDNMRAMANLSPKGPRHDLRKVERPSKEELTQLVWSMTKHEVGKLFGVSGSTIGAWCKEYEIEGPSSKHWMHTMIMQKTCEVCKTIFDAPGGASIRQKYCSRSCKRIKDGKTKRAKTGAKERVKIQRPSADKLHELVWSMTSREVGKIFGVSRETIYDWCRSYGITKPPVGYHNNSLSRKKRD
jgi:group I intron endonuclease